MRNSAESAGRILQVPPLPCLLVTGQISWLDIGDDEFQGYLQRISSVFRASCTMFRVAGGGSTVGQMQRIYGWRVNERRKVRKGWQQVSPFVQGQQLGEGLSDRQVWRLEKELPQCSDRFLLPLQLRELYLIANGQCCEQQTGIMNGHRWMPLQEIVELWKERNWSSVEQEAVPKRAAEGAGCREGRQGCVYDRFAYGFGVELITSQDVGERITAAWRRSGW